MKMGKKLGIVLLVLAVVGVGSSVWWLVNTSGHRVPPPFKLTTVEGTFWAVHLSIGEPDNIPLKRVTSSNQVELLMVRNENKTKDEGLSFHLKFINEDQGEYLKIYTMRDRVNKEDCKIDTIQKINFHYELSEGKITLTPIGDENGEESILGFHDNGDEIFIEKKGIIETNMFLKTDEEQEASFLLYHGGKTK